MFKYLILFTITLTACTVEPNKKGYTRDLEGTDLSLYGKDNLEYRKRVVVIDSGLNKSDLDKRYMCGDIASISPDKVHNDHHKRGHGTNTVSIISKGMDYDKYCITMIRIQKTKGNGYIKAIDAGFRSIKYASRNLYAINISMRTFVYNYESFKVFKELARNGVQINAAASNEGKNIDKKCRIFPACYSKLIKSPNFKVIGASQNFSNYGNVVDVFVSGGPRGIPLMQGTSQATALYTSYLVK